MTFQNYSKGKSNTHRRGAYQHIKQNCKVVGVTSF